MSLLNYLAGNYVGLESRRVYGKIWYDEKEQAFGKRGMLAKRHIHAEPRHDTGRGRDRRLRRGKKWIGNIEEEFLTKLKQGDIFALGGKLYQFEHSSGMSCYVTDAKSKRTDHTAVVLRAAAAELRAREQIGEFREQFSGMLKAYIKSKKIRSMP